MKKILSFLFVAVLALNSNSIFAKSTSPEKSISTEVKKNMLTREDYYRIEERVKEIRNMDKNAITTEQRQAFVKRSGSFCPCHEFRKHGQPSLEILLLTRNCFLHWLLKSSKHSNHLQKQHSHSWSLSPRKLRKETFSFYDIIKNPKK